MWGAVESNGQQEVDTQGNIFLPQVGPINVLGILNSDLNKKVSTAISRIYKKDVFIYDGGTTVITAPYLFDELFNLFNKGLFKIKQPSYLN